MTEDVRILASNLGKLGCLPTGKALEAKKDYAQVVLGWHCFVNFCQF